MEIARLLDVSTDWLRKLFRQRRRLGHAAPLARGGGRRALLPEANLLALRAASGRAARRQPGEEFATRFARAAGAPVSTGTSVVHRARAQP